VEPICHSSKVWYNGRVLLAMAGGLMQAQECAANLRCKPALQICAANLR
jgi:hypothetical protein